MSRRALITTLTMLGALAATAWFGSAPAVAAQSQLANSPGLLHLQTVPALAGVVVKVDGRSSASDAKGRIVVAVSNFVRLERRIRVPDTQVGPDRRVAFDRFRGELLAGARGRVIELGVRTSRLVSWEFVDRLGNAVDIDRVQRLRLRSSTGEVLDLAGAAVNAPIWVADSRTQQTPRGLLSKQLYYVVDSAVVDGTSVVNRAQQRFTPWIQRQWRVQLLFFRVSFTGSDLLFAAHAGGGVELIGPDGIAHSLAFDKDGKVTVWDLPRGAYQIRVYGGGLSFSRPVSISKDQQVVVNVISWLDLVLIAAVLLSLAFGLILLGRPQLRQWLRVRATRGAKVVRMRITAWLQSVRQREVLSSGSPGSN